MSTVSGAGLPSTTTSSINNKKKVHHQYTNTRKRTALNRVGNNNTTKVGSYSITWKRIIQCLFLSLIGGYILFLYLAQNHYYNKHNDNHQFGEKSGGGEHDYWSVANDRNDENVKSRSGGRLMKKDEFVVTSSHHNPPQGTDTEGGTIKQRSPRKMFHQINQNQQQHHDDTFSDKYNSGGKRGDNKSSLNNVPAKKRRERPVGNMHDYIFKQMEQHPQEEEQSTTSNKSINVLSKDAFQKLQKARTNRRKDRMVRTTPPSTSSSSTTTTIPLWYKLDYSSEDTIKSIQSRWRNVEEDDQKNDNVDEKQVDDIDPSSLCGSYAKEAAKHYPQNYPHHTTTTTQQPSLGSNSRVLITGILSPLGLHLALSLSRQCNVTSFMGLDTQFPNDALSRLEQNERLAVLRQELDGFGQLHVPFMGLEVKHVGGSGSSGIEGLEEKNLREKKLVELRNKVTSSTSTSSSTIRDAFYTKPYTKYGIPLTPGTSHDGYGSLDVILSYRPTHIVHLAGTQSDSLLNSNYHHHHTQGGDDILSPPSSSGRYHPPVFQDKSEEEDDILQQTISSRPHLYDLRMGTTGMEQLLSGVVSQTMFSDDNKNKFDNNNGKRSDLEKKNMQQQRLPHVVYASSYDALHFRDIDTQLNPKVQKKRKNTKAASNDEEESLGSISPPLSLHNKRLTSRGLHGMSRLIDEIISSSYHALYNVHSIGLRFDAIYGPRGFGVPSTSIPIFHADRIKRTKRGVSPDVDLAETAVRSLYKKWTADVKVKRDKEAAAEEEEESDDEVEEEEEERRRLSEEARHMSLIEESGWMHLAHDQRDFVFVEGK